MSISRNKKALLGSEFVIWFFRFLLLIIIIVMIVAAVSVFYSKQYDVRQIEANILSDKLVQCLTDDGVMKESNFNEAFAKCLPNTNENDYYINLSIKLPRMKSIYYGKKDLELICQLKKIKLQYPPACLNQKYYVVFDNGEEKDSANFNMLIAIAKLEKNA
jgi:hypothetical protein